MTIIHIIYQLILHLPLISAEIFGIMLIYTVIKNDQAAKKNMIGFLLSAAAMVSIYILKSIIPMTNSFLSSSMMKTLMILAQSLLCIWIIFRETQHGRPSSLRHQFSCLFVFPFFLGIMSVIGPLAAAL